MIEPSPDDYDPAEGAALVNEIMAEDDINDPYLESYQHYGEKVNQAMKAALDLP